MSALSITAANVSLNAGSEQYVEAGVAGEAFIAGACVYKAADGTWKKAQCDGTTIEAGEYGLGMALATADAAGARIQVARPGAIVTVGAGLAGAVYCVGATAGSINPVADISSGQKVVPIAVLYAANKLKLVDTYSPGSALA